MATRKEKIHGLKQARKALKFKLKMESPFRKELRSYFFSQYKLVKSGLELETISPMLDKQYYRVIKNMTGIKLKQEDDKYGLGDKLTIFLLGLSSSRAGFIDKTTQKKLKRARDLAIDDLAEDGIRFPSQTLLNNTTAQIFKQLNRARPGSIAISETQMITENTQAIKNQVADEIMRDAIVDGDTVLAQDAAKLSESMTMENIADNIGKKEPRVLFEALALLRKMWVTMGDSKVRPWHSNANFQVVPIDNAFIVNGERLKFPGDTSLGASIENVANCRCHASYL